MGGNEEEGTQLFSVVPMGKTKENGHTLKPMKFHVNITQVWFGFVFFLPLSLDRSQTQVAQGQFWSLHLQRQAKCSL